MSNPKFNIFINKKTIPITDRGFSYGDGLFETILVKNNKLLFFPDHAQRLLNGCDILEIKKPSMAVLKKSAVMSIGKSDSCIIKIIITRGNSLQGYRFPASIKPNIYFIKIPVVEKKENNSVKLGVSKYLLKNFSELSKIKHMNRLEQVLIVNELNKHSKISDLAVMSVKKNIIETLSSNIFFVEEKQKALVFETPCIESCGIEGVMRKNIIKFLKQKKYQIIIKNININTINKYNYCFKVNSISGVIFIDQIGKNKFLKPKFLYNELKSFIY